MSTTNHTITRKAVQTAIEELTAKRVHCNTNTRIVFAKITNEECSIKRTNLEHLEVTKIEIEALLSIYKAITKNQDRMDRLQFRDVLHNSFDMTDDVLMDRSIYFWRFVDKFLVCAYIKMKCL